MTAEEKLNRVRRGKAEYSRINDRVEELEAIAEKTTASLTGMPRSSGGHKDDTWAALADYRDKLIYELNFYIKDCQELEQELECINNLTIRTAMLYRYVNCETVERIAERMDYSVRQTYNLLSTGKRIYMRCIGDDTEPMAI